MEGGDGRALLSLTPLGERYPQGHPFVSFEKGGLFDHIRDIELPVVMLWMGGSDLV